MDEASQGAMIMGPPPTDVGEKTPSAAKNIVTYVEESLNDSTPITSMALAVWKESPSAPPATNLLLCLLVMAVESLSIKVDGASSGSMSRKESKD